MSETVSVTELSPHVVTLLARLAAATERLATAMERPLPDSSVDPEHMRRIRDRLTTPVLVPDDPQEAIRVWSDAAFAFADDCAVLLKELDRLRGAQ